MKHTPGPWKLLVEGDEDTCVVRTVVIDGKPRNLSEVALITTGAMSDDVEAANAKLIAAAPDMLSVLQEALKTYEECGQILSFDVNRIRTAIKKATE